MLLVHVWNFAVKKIFWYKYTPLSPFVYMGLLSILLYNCCIVHAGAICEGVQYKIIMCCAHDNHMVT